MYLGSVCGAVTGGIMAIGLKRGGVAMQQSIQTAGVVRRFAEEFKAKHGSINCPQLTGVDLSTFDLTNPAALNEAYAKAVADKSFARCAGYVADATKMVTGLLSVEA